MHFIKSIIIYAFIIFASLPAFMTTDVGIKGINMANILWVLMILFVFIPKFLTHKLELTGLEKNIIFLIIVIFISVLRGYMTYNYDSYQLWFYSFLKPVQFLILYIIIYNHFHTIKEIYNILFLHVIVSIGLSILLLWTYQQNLTQLVAGAGFMSARTGGIHVNPNSLTLGFLYSLFILYLFYQHASSIKEKILYILISSPIILGILFSYTRVSWIAGIIGFIFYAFLMVEKNKITKLFMIICSLGIIIYNVPETVKIRAKTLGIFSVQNSIVGQSEEVRLEFAISGIRYLKDHPWKIPFGGGIGDYEHNAYKYSQHWQHQKGRDAHNTLVSYLCSIGLVGVVFIFLFYSKIISLARMLRRVGNNSFTKNFGTMIIVQLIVYIIYTLVSTTLLLWDYQTESVIFSSIVGCAFILRKTVLIDMYENSKSIMKI